MKNIICDIDSTMSDHWKRVRRNTVPKWPGSVISGKAWSREEVLQDKLLPNCHKILWGLQTSGFNIRYLTARGWTHARRITIDQLTSWEVPNPHDIMITSNMVSKIEILSPNICDYYIDDFMTGQENNIGTFRKNVAEAIQGKGVKVIVFRNDWLDVLEQIQIYEEREKAEIKDEG